MIVLLILISLLAIHYIIFLIEIRKGLINLGKTPILNSSEKFISVIIPFKNESESILTILSSLEEQNYPSTKFEVIFVDDHSTDETFRLLNENIKPENFRVLRNEASSEINAGKKTAIETGIKNAIGEIILLTDADCIVPVNWMKTMTEYFSEDVGMVAGPVIFNEGNSLFGGFQKLEFAGIILASAGLIGYGKPTTCSSANLAFTRKAFNEVDGYQGVEKFSSGDDEFLMQKIHNQTDYKIAYSFNKHAVVATTANSTVKNFFNQRSRWASKGLHYLNKGLTLKLILIFLFYLSLPVQLICGIAVDNIYLISLDLAFSAKMIFEFRVMVFGNDILFDRLSVKNFIAAQLIQIHYVIIAPIFGTFGKVKWKGKRYKK
ncbi:MAG: glycosyltransferase [Bacteroidetes bacterium]|nr:glycosyltransferase [Bacteroidota bacterium]